MYITKLMTKPQTHEMSTLKISESWVGSVGWLNVISFWQYVVAVQGAAGQDYVNGKKIYNNSILTIASEPTISLKHSVCDI